MGMPGDATNPVNDATIIHAKGSFPTTASSFRSPPKLSQASLAALGFPVLNNVVPRALQAQRACPLYSQA